MEMYKLIGIILIFTGIVDTVVLPKILSRVERNSALITSIVLVFALGTIIIGILCFLGKFGEF